MRADRRCGLTAVFTKEGFGTLRHVIAHASLKTPVWAAMLATSSKIPEGTFLHASVVAYGAWSRRCNLTAHRTAVASRIATAIRRRLATPLPDPPIVMVLVACSGVLMLPAVQSTEPHASVPNRYALSCNVVEPTPSGQDLLEKKTPGGNDAHAARGNSRVRKDATGSSAERCENYSVAVPTVPEGDGPSSWKDAAAETVCPAERWWHQGAAPGLIARDNPLEHVGNNAIVHSRFDVFLHAQEISGYDSIPTAPIASAATPTPEPDQVLDVDARTQQLRYRIRSGETVSDILDAAGIHPSEVQRWVDAAQRVYDLDRVYAGQAIALDVDLDGSFLQRLALDIDHRTRLIAERRDGTIVAQRDTIHYRRRLRLVTGRIDSSLYMAAVSRGVPDRIISDMAEVLGWEINFSKDLRPGATFRVIYEELIDPQGTESRSGRVLAVDVLNRGRHYEAFYFRPTADTVGGYYDRDGNALGRAFLRYPVAFSRISSRFSTARLHPVLKRQRPHYGVDFAAPAGTPVHAIAKGTVTTAGWQGPNGRLVKIRHDATYESAYAHLSRIAPDVHRGKTVSKGQVIGYVGSSGLATGPHLHLALYKRGAYVDPLAVTLPRAPALTGLGLARFRRTVGVVAHAYASANDSDVRLTRLAAASAGF